MGILNVTPDSFSDGGRFLCARGGAGAGARRWPRAAEILDIGGESTRPGAAEVPVAEEIARTAPVIAALRDGGLRGADLDRHPQGGGGRGGAGGGRDAWSTMSRRFDFDPALAPLVAQAGVPVVPDACAGHARDDAGRPAL